MADPGERGGATSADAAGGVVGRAARVALGAALAAVGQLADDREPGSQGVGTAEAPGAPAAQVPLGAAVSAARAAGRVADVGLRGVGVAVGAARSMTPTVVARWADDTGRQLAERGRAEVALAQDAFLETTGSAGQAVLQAGTTGDLIQAAVARYLPTLVDQALPQVIDQALPLVLEKALPAAFDQLATPAMRARIDALALGVVDDVIDPIIERALPDALARLSDDDMLDRLEPLVVALVDRLLDPLVQRALPVVFDRLNADPSEVRQLVMGQTMGVAEELGSGVRTLAVTGDAGAERVARRLTLRRRRRELGGPGPAVAPVPPALPAAGSVDAPRDPDGAR